MARLACEAAIGTVRNLGYSIRRRRRKKRNYTSQLSRIKPPGTCNTITWSARCYITSKFQNSSGSKK
ncbi:hypothetical protein SUGI_0819640 [Cryptomeria japonica]|nr:hypothetical protein SUGI_0819640 [Cryptomeria japonica]